MTAPKCIEKLSDFYHAHTDQIETVYRGDSDVLFLSILVNTNSTIMSLPKVLLFCPF